jgi:succinyl-CoA synthetase beta subunit
VIVPSGRVVLDEEAAVAALSELGGDALVLKLSSPRVQHKSDLGGVIVGLDTEADVRSAYPRLAELAAEHDGVVLAERMAEPGVELMVAARTDGVVPCLVLGLGGIWTELLDDVAIVPLPADAARVEAALRSLRGAPVLLGARGEAAVDLASVARLAQRLGEVLLDSGFAVIECNPVIAGASGAVAVDAAIQRGDQR